MSVSAAQQKKEDDYRYDGTDLGAVYNKKGTTFKVWAPTASEVKLRRYREGIGENLIEEREMEQDIVDGAWGNGVWKATVTGDIVDTYYTYLVTVNGTTKETNDIYAKAVGVNGIRGMVVDLAKTNPEGFEQDRHVMVDKPTDAVVWEVHVRDFSSDESSGMVNKGTFLAFTEKGTTVGGKGEISTGIDYLKDLGVNYVQLLPSFDHFNIEDGSDDSYNWGYNPLNYNVPDGSYSSNPFDGNVRIREYKQMVQALHREGIGVILDVVYNHVGTDAVDSWFDCTVPGYYFRMDAEGNFCESGTACGNETASETAMFRKYMMESVVYWASEYHIDGFRFDLMGCHDVETMNQIRAALDQLPDGERILMYGEPWSAAATNAPEGVVMANKENMTQLNERIGAFNDQIRDSLKGYVFDGRATGFVQGGIGAEQPEQAETYRNEDVMAAIQANTNEAYSDRFLNCPGQAVSYVSCHDNLALYDKLVSSVLGEQEEGSAAYYERNEKLVQMNKMAAAVYLTSQGCVFFQAGEEFARTKGGVENSFESPLYFADGRELNAIDWNRIAAFSDLHAYYKGLLALRKAYAPFRAQDMSTVRNMAFSEDTTENLVAYTIASPGEKWDMSAVLVNANDEPQDVLLKAVQGYRLPKVWNCVVNQERAGTAVLAKYEGSTITVPARTAFVLMADKA